MKIKKKYHLEITNSAPDNIKKSKIKNYAIDEIKFNRINGKKDLSSIIYNEYINIKNIPVEAYKYIINGKSPIEWVVDRYKKTIDKKSKTHNDPNSFSLETENNPTYILELIQKIITVSIETQKLINKLPKLNNNILTK